MKRYDVVIFDLGDVLIKGLLGVEKIINLKTGKSADFVLQKLGGHKLTSLFLGDLSETDYWQIFIKESGININVTNLKNIVRENFKLNNKVFDILKLLYQQNYPLFLLSEHCEEWITFCSTTFNYQQYFKCCYYSYETKMLKNNVDTYKYVTNHISKLCNIKNIYFIDDSETNIQLANSIGMHGIHFSTPEFLQKKLVAKNLLP